jgi:glycosyltransferase involved in cell wall biosynthesis
MRILFCNKYNFPFSGTEVYLFELMALLRARGHEVELFSMADPRGGPSAYSQYRVPAIDFKARAGGAGRVRQAIHAVYSPQARRCLRGMLQDFKPCVAHVRNIYHHLSPSTLWELRAQGVPVLYHINDFKLICPSYNLVRRGQACERCAGRRFWHVVEGGCYAGGLGQSVVLAAEAYAHKWLRTYEKCVHRFLAPSAFVRDKLAENGFPARNIDVLPHFQALPTEPPVSPPGAAPVLYFGRLSPEKGLVDLLHAMAMLPQIPCRIAGSGPQRAELERLSRELGMKNVEFVGQLQGPPLENAIREARFSILPSLAYETLGKTILESYAQSRAVIATDLGSRRELVRDGETGILYPPGNRKELARSIDFLYGQPSLADQMGAQGRELVRDYHSPEKHYQALMGIYGELVRGTAHVPLRRQVKPPNLRIAFIGGRGVGAKYSGIESFYEEAGGRLAEKGHSVTAYCRTYFTPPVSMYSGLQVLRQPTIRTKHLDTFVHTALATLHAMFQRYDVVHYHTLGPALFSFLPRLVGAKTVVTVQGLDWQRKKWGRIASWVLRLGERAAIHLPDSTVVVSRALQSYFEHHHGASPVYIPNGTTLRRKINGDALAQWGLTSDRYILFLGRFSPEKNCDLLIRAYEQLETDAKLVLAGGSSHSDDYAEQLRSHRSERVRVLDWIAGADLEALLTHAMIFVLPSDLEGLSLALLDAMGAGLCVLTSDIPENRELVDGAGFTFRRGNQPDLTRMLELLIGNPEIRRRAGQKAQERIRQQYLWPVIVDQVEREYFRILGWRVTSAKMPDESNVSVTHDNQEVA